MDCCRTWFAFLAAEVIQQSVDSCEKDCPACMDGLYSPLLHFHNMRNLREKLDLYYYRVISEMDISELFNKFILHFGWLTLDNDEFVAIGQHFVRFSTPDAIYFGKYITKQNDFALYGSSGEVTEVQHPAKTIKAKRTKKNTISHDGVPGASTSN